MNQPDIFKDYLSFGILDENGIEYDVVIREIESMLSDPTASSRRIAYLESLSGSIEGSGVENPQPINDPMSVGQHFALVEKGLKKAVNDGDVTLEQVRRLAHSIEGLREFSSALLSVPDERHASCWDGALSVPFEPREIEFDDASQEVQLAEVWDKALEYAREWLDSLVPKMKRPALGFRDAVKKQPDTSVDEKSLVGQVGRLKPQLDKLSDFQGNIPSTEIAEIFGRIPWQRIKDIIREGITWRDFLINSGQFTFTEIKPGEIEELLHWLDSPEAGEILKRSDVQLIKLILQSTLLQKD